MNGAVRKRLRQTPIDEFVGKIPKSDTSTGIYLYDDILLYVMEFLPIRDQCAISQTTKAFRALLSNKNLAFGQWLEYCIETDEVLKKTKTLDGKYQLVKYFEQFAFLEGNARNKIELAELHMNYPIKNPDRFKRWIMTQFVPKKYELVYHAFRCHSKDWKMLYSDLLGAVKHGMIERLEWLWTHLGLDFVSNVLKADDVVGLGSFEEKSLYIDKCRVVMFCIDTVFFDYQVTDESEPATFKIIEIAMANEQLDVIRWAWKKGIHLSVDPKITSLISIEFKIQLFKATGFDIPVDMLTCMVEEAARRNEWKTVEKYGKIEKYRLDRSLNLLDFGSVSDIETVLSGLTEDKRSLYAVSYRFMRAVEENDVDVGKLTYRWLSDATLETLTIYSRSEYKLWWWEHMETLERICTKGNREFFDWYIGLDGIQEKIKTYHEPPIEYDYEKMAAHCEDEYKTRKSVLYSKFNLDRIIPRLREVETCFLVCWIFFWTCRSNNLKFAQRQAEIMEERMACKSVLKWFYMMGLETAIQSGNVTIMEWLWRHPRIVGALSECHIQTMIDQSIYPHRGWKSVRYLDTQIPGCIKPYLRFMIRKFRHISNEDVLEVMWILTCARKYYDLKQLNELMSECNLRYDIPTTLYMQVWADKHRIPIRLDDSKLNTFKFPIIK